MNDRVLPLLIVLAAAGMLAVSGAFGASGDEVSMGDLTPVDDGDESSDNDDGAFDVSDDPQQNRDAALYMLRSCENTAASVADETCYQTFYGGALFWDLSNHPAVTGEMTGVPLAPQTCINAGFADGVCVSTAAGGYQITKGTWVPMQAANPSLLPDFTPESQDAAALLILAQIGALPLIDSGNIAAAIPIMGKKWASLPGAIGKQGQKTLQYAMGKFNDGMAAYA